MNRPLEGRTALITGAAKRLGKQMALSLAEQGANVVIHYSRSGDEAEATQAELQALGVDSWTVQADVSDRHAAEALMHRAVALAGPVDILINNASIFLESQLHVFTWEELLTNLQIHAYGPLQLMRAAAAQDRDGRPGAASVINMLDTRYLEYDRAHAAYHLSKRMLFSLTRMAALEYAPAVRVNGIAPGLVLPPPGKDESHLEALAHTNPMQTYGGPEDIARAAVFLSLSEFVTGQVIFVDGGYHMKGSMYG